MAIQVPTLKIRNRLFLPYWGTSHIKFSAIPLTEPDDISQKYTEFLAIFSNYNRCKIVMGVTTIFYFCDFLLGEGALSLSASLV